MKPALPVRPSSLRRVLLIGILLPLGFLIAVNALSLYGQTLAAINTAYDRTLLASAKSIGEQLDVIGFEDAAKLSAAVPYAALEAFEADNQSRMYYRVSTPGGELISGYAQLKFWRGQLPAKPPYAALVDFYDESFDGEQVRVAVLLQPVASEKGRGMAVIQVAETLELRRTLARSVLLDTLWRQALLLAVIAAVVTWVVQRATRPVRLLSEQLQRRAPGDLSPIQAADAPRELLPLLDATNAVMARLQGLLEHQKRFVRDAAHQLRTPLAVLKVQVQSALRGDAAPLQALGEISQTVNRATELANQMLALAKVEQLRQSQGFEALDWAPIVRGVALDLSPLLAEKSIVFDIETAPAWVSAHVWMLGEMSRNLLHNAVLHSPAGGALTVSLAVIGQQAVLSVADCGPGISPELQARLFQPFSRGTGGQGAGLGLAICGEIVATLGGDIRLENRLVSSGVGGLIVTVTVPLRTD